MDVESVWYGDSPVARATAAALAPAAALFGAAVRAKSFLHDRGLLVAARAPRPVVSVGALSVGGAGKTPFVLWLVRELAARGLAPCVVTRGYGRTGDASVLLRPGELARADGARLADAAARAGDEPTLLAARSGVAVAVGVDRLRACRDALAALEAAGSRVDLFVLDDGFQHRRLHRDLDVVVLAGDEGWRRLLPAGPLREGPWALRRAHAVASPADPAWAPALPAGPLALRTTRRPAGLVRSVGDATLEPSSSLAGARVVAVAGIARPGRFVADLDASGARVVARVLRPDHHRYGPADLRAIDEAARGADLVVTTEKDLVKLAGLGGDAPMKALRVELDVEGGEPLLRRIEGLVPR